MNPMAFILKSIQQVRDRMLLNRLLYTMLLGGILGGAAGLAVLLAALWVPIYYAPAAALFLLSLGLFAGVCYSFVTRPSPQKAAQAADRAGMGESLITALEFRHSDQIFHRLQREQTARRLNEYDVDKAIPIRVPKRECGLFALTLCLCLVFTLIPTDARASAQEQHHMQEMIREEAVKIEKVLKQLDEEKDTTGLSEAELEALSQLLNSALSEMENAESQEALEKSLDRLDKKLEMAMEQAESQEFATKTLEIAGDLGLPSQLEEQMRQERIQQKVQDALESGNANGLSEEELAQWAEQLSQELAEGTLSEESIAQAAEALGMSEDELREALERIERETAPQGQGGQSGAQPGQSGQSGQGGEGGQEGAGNGEGEGEGGEEGAGEGEGQAGQGYDTGGRTGFEKDDSAIRSSEELEIPGRAVGGDDNLTGSRTEGDSYFVETEEGLSWSGRRVDYNEVAGEYAERARNEINRAEIPGDMKDIVRDYFSALTD